MKLIIALLISFISYAAFSLPTIELNSKEIMIPSDESILVRTAQTPRKVKLTMKIPVTKTQCVNWGYKTVYGQNAYKCGTHTEYKTEWRPVTRCVMYQNGRCVRYETRYEWVTVAISVANSCYYQISVCLEYAPVTHYETDRVSIVFKKDLPKLSSGEREEFKIKGFNSPSGFDKFSYSLEVVKTSFDYEIDRSSFLDRFVIRNR